MPPYGSKYAVYFIDAPELDEGETMERLQKHYDLRDAPEGELAAFMLKALEQKWDKNHFEEQLQFYNDDLRFNYLAEALEERHNISPDEFVDIHGCPFCEHYPQFNDMLTFEGGSDWKHLQVYAEYGLEFMEKVCDFMETIEDEADQAAASDTRRTKRKFN
jgi:hypothetical protein